MRARTDAEEFVLIPFCALKKDLTEDKDKGEETYEYENKASHYRINFNSSESCTPGHEASDGEKGDRNYG